MDVCWDGRGRRQIGDACCECPPSPCEKAVCTMDICWDGIGRRPIDDDCCACPPLPDDKCPKTDVAFGACSKDTLGCKCDTGIRCIKPPCPSQGLCNEVQECDACADALCPADICPDGKGRRQI